MGISVTIHRVALFFHCFQIELSVFVSFNLNISACNDSFVSSCLASRASLSVLIRGNTEKNN